MCRIEYVVSAILLLIGVCSCRQKVVDCDYTQYVDQYIGTGGHGHVFLGVSHPFGAVQLGPVNYSQDWDWCSGYHYSDTTIVGFSHTHLSGTGVGDLGDIALMPVCGDVVLSARGDSRDYKSNFYSAFSRSTESAVIGRYAVALERYDIDVELTATPRVGLHRYTFNKGDDSNGVVIDLSNGLGWDKPVSGAIRFENDSTIYGYRFSKGWAKDQRVYFYAKFSQPISSIITSDNDVIAKGEQYISECNIVRINFDCLVANTLLVKVAISSVSSENAKINMENELPYWDFDSVVLRNKNAWNDQLRKIEVSTQDQKQLRNFYTALYHTMIAPSLFNDVTGDYRGAESDFTVHNQSGQSVYTTLSLWDTYRAAHPLMTIIHPEKVDDIIQSMLNIYTQQGYLPIWHLHSNETGCMVGNPAIPVIVDAYMKGFRNYDIMMAYNAIVASAMKDHRDLDLYKKYGYIPCDSTVESVSKALEYAMADGCIALMAANLKREDDYKYFLARSKSYLHYFDKQTQFIRPKNSSGEWKEPFDPTRAVQGVNDYTEGNAWQYTWLVPHDIYGLIEAFGSVEAFVIKLDSLFTTGVELSEDAAVDVSGLIGQYAHGNEPSHHIAYLYAYVGQQWKCAKMVRRIIDEMYNDTSDGLCGNEDVGQMSAWYVLSSMGIYQVNPVGGDFIIGSPIFDNIKINVGNGKCFQIIIHNNSSQNIYINRAKLNGKDYNRFKIDYSDIIAGGELELWMNCNPNTKFGQ